MLPYTGGIEGTANGALIFAFVAALLYLLRPDTAGGVKYAALKTIPLALFTFIAWQLQAPWLLIVGLALSALGDWCLAFEGEKAFLGGLGSFFVAHLAYIALFAGFGPEQSTSEPWRVVVAVALLAHALWMSLKLARAVPSELKYPVFAYVTAISLMGISAAAYGSLTVILGALVFALSDTLLATGKFLVGALDPRQKLISAGVWITYIASQTLLLLAFTI